MPIRCVALKSALQVFPLCTASIPGALMLDKALGGCFLPAPCMVRMNLLSWSPSKWREWQHLLTQTPLLLLGMAERWRNRELASAWDGWREHATAAAWARQAAAAAVLFWRKGALAAAWARWTVRAAARARFLGSIEAAAEQLRAAVLSDAFAGWRQHAQQRSVVTVSCPSFASSLIAWGQSCRHRSTDLLCT